MAWYFYDAWVWSQGAWRRVYKRGPMWLSQSDATNEHLNTAETFLEGVAREFRWTGAAWEQIA